MLTIELLKEYSEKNEIQLYKLKDKMGKFYGFITYLIGEWEKEIKRGYTTTVPPLIEEKSLDLALLFIEINGFSKDKTPKHEYMQKLSSWALSKSEEYFLKRMSELTPNQQDLQTTLLDGEVTRLVDCFTCDIATGNIEILVTRLDGSPILYPVITKSGEEEYIQDVQYKITRYAKPQMTDNGLMKYGLPKDQGTAPFFPQKVKELFEQKKQFDTLFLTEGSIKAFKASLHGLLVVGLSSITHYRDKESTKQNPKIHKDIVTLIKTCKVQNVVVLWDGDCRDINKKDLNLEMELTDRPNGFFKAAKKVRDLLEKEKIQGLKVYFSTIRTENIEGKPKGIDDLFIQVEKGEKKEVDKVTKFALSLENKPNPYFFFSNITNSTDTIYEYFGLNASNNFYSRHRDIIENKEFIFKGDRFRYSELKNELVLLQPKFLQDLRWIGDDFFQLVDVPIPSKDGTMKTTKELKRVLKSTLKDLYGTDFIKYMVNKHYTGFCNVPDHFNYQYEIETAKGSLYYNKYFPFEYQETTTGICDTILGFVGHIFGAQKEMGLDYLQLLLLHPTQKLPVLCLYSPENATGKSKFGELIAQMFKNNVVFINNDDLKSEFGLDRFADKLVAVCDETLLERKKDVERIKFVSTAEEALTINPKGMSAYLLHTYVKLIFNSNNLRMIHATENDERFWIIRVQKPKHSDPDLIEKMKAEIPFFIDYLKKRKISTKKESRMWFHKDLIKTETLEQVIKVNEHADVQELRNKLEDYFIDFPNESFLMLSTKDLIEELMPGKSRAWMDEILTNRLSIEKYSVDGKTTVKRGYILYKEQRFQGDNDKYDDKKRCKAPQRVWVFYRKDFITEELSYEDEGALTEDFINKANDSVKAPF